MNAIERELREIETCLVPPMRVVQRDKCAFTPQGFRFFLGDGKRAWYCIQTKSGDGKQLKRSRQAIVVPNMGNASN